MPGTVSVEFVLNVGKKLSESVLMVINALDGCVEMLTLLLEHVVFIAKLLQSSGRLDQLLVNRNHVRRELLKHCRLLGYPILPVR